MKLVGLQTLNNGSPTPRQKVISGGQTGVDRAALNAAVYVGLPIGGWCPKGRLAEDGRIPESYPLQECSLPGYPVRTRANVSDSEGTLVIVRGESYGRGTQLTLRCAQELGKPYLLIDLSQPAADNAVLSWLREKRIKVLNVAGPRESGSPGIQAEAEDFLRLCFKSWKDTDPR
jgi:hypothetical protein